MEARIIFIDGTEITAEINGNCFITQNKPTFPADMSTVTVESEDGEQVYDNAYLIECASVDGRYWFAFGKESQMEATIRELRETNDMLTECILEMSEIIYGGE